MMIAFAGGGVKILNFLCKLLKLQYFLSCRMRDNFKNFQALTMHFHNVTIIVIFMFIVVHVLQSVMSYFM